MWVLPMSCSYRLQKAGAHVVCAAVAIALAGGAVRLFLYLVLGYDPLG